MGAAVSCALFESFSTALHWFVQNQSGCEDILHYLDDFLFRESAGSTQCKDILKLFQDSCKLWGVPLADNKTVEPTEVLIFLGIEFNTINMVMLLPDEKLIELRNKIESCLACTKISLQDLQSLLGSLNFACQAIVPGEHSADDLLTLLAMFAGRPYHKIRATLAMKDYLRVWLLQWNHGYSRSILVF